MKAKLLSLVLILALISSHGKAGGAPVARAATSQAVNVSQLYDVARLLPLSNTNPEVMVYGINESGWAAGFSTASPSGYHAVLWQNTTPTDLGTTGGASSFAYGLNDAGQVVGKSATSSNTEEVGFLWQPGSVMQPLPTTGVNGQGTAWAVNNAGLVVGSSREAYPVNSLAGTWVNGSFNNLPVGDQSNAFAVSNSGHIVGSAGAGAFLRQNGVTTPI